MRTCCWADPAAAGSYAELGVREVSPDGRYLAYSVDFDGDEVYQLRIRDLATGTDLAERIERTYYGLAWAADSRALLYVVTDPAYRPHEVWRHELGTAPDGDTLVYREDDERFELTVRATRSGAWLLIETASRDTTETLLIPAGDIRADPAVAEKRRPGTEYYADHADGPGGGELYLVTNAGAAEFRLVRAPVTRPGAAAWTEVIGPAPDTRLVRCDVFGRYLVVEQRRGAQTELRVVDRETGAQYLIGAGLTGAGGPEQALALAVNEEYTASAVTVRTESLTEPPSWHDVDLASGRWELRKRQEVPGYDPAGYVTERISAPAADGTLIPVTVGVPPRAAPRRVRARPAVRLRRLRGVFLAGVQRRHAEPAGPRVRVRGGARARRRRGRPPLVGRGSPGPQAHHVHRLHRGRRHAGRAAAGRPRTGSPRAACRPGGCCRARCSPWRRAAGGRWSPRSRSWTW